MMHHSTGRSRKAGGRLSHSSTPDRNRERAPDQEQYCETTAILLLNDWQEKVGEMADELCSWQLLIIAKFQNCIVIDFKCPINTTSNTQGLHAQQPTHLFPSVLSLISASQSKHATENSLSSPEFESGRELPRIRKFTSRGTKMGRRLLLPAALCLIFGSRKEVGREFPFPPCNGIFRTGCV